VAEVALTSAGLVSYWMLAKRADATGVPS